MLCREPTAIPDPYPPPGKLEAYLAEIARIEWIFLKRGNFIHI
jgi:hypothetical protein